MKKISLLLFISCAFYIFAQDVYAAKKQKPMKVKIETTLGDIKVELYDDTPLHRDNFIKLVQENFYDSTLFHRVIPEFMIQAGDPTSKNADSLAHLGAGNLGYKVPAEIIFPSHFHKRGALAAARQADFVNPERESSASQFYIVQGKRYTEAELDTIEQRLKSSVRSESPIRFNDAQRRHYKTFGGTPHLDGQYTVFGEVIEGLDIVQKISEVETNDRDRPKVNVVITGMKVVKR